MFTDAVIDLETMSLDPRDFGAILQIGVVTFDRYADKPLETLTVWNYNIETHTMHGEQKTIDWWNSTNPKYFEHLLKAPNAVPIDRALESLANTLQSDNLQAVWGNGVLMDNAFLINIYHKLLKPVPWTYRQDACFRTIMSQVVTDYKSLKGAAKHFTEDYNKVDAYWQEHNACFDAMLEAVCLIESGVLTNGIL